MRKNSLVHLFLYSTAKSELQAYDETPNLVNFMLMSHTANHASFMLKAHLLRKVPMKVNKGAKIRNRYNQVPHLTQDNDGK